MKAKIIITTAFFLLISVTCVCGQQRVKRYCEIEFTYQPHWKTVGPDVTVKINAGETENVYAFKDSTILSRLKKAETFKTIPGAMNYLSEIGWNYEVPLITGYPHVGPLSIRLLLSKDFEPSDVISVSK